MRPGEFWFFLGPNGAGKTTLLKALLEEIRPQRGRILTDPELYRRENLGFVPQRCDLNPTLSTTVREFVLLGLVGIRANRQERETRLAWALDKAGLTGMSSKNYWSLSGGQRQRALVARALVRRPRILFLDEPTRGLDLAAEEAVMQSLTDLNRQELLTVLFVTHDLTLAARYASHVALFHNGQVQGGPISDIMTPDRSAIHLWHTGVRGAGRPRAGDHKHGKGEQGDMIQDFAASWHLFHNSYLAGWLIGLLLALIGVLVVARNQIFIGVAVSQASTLGIALTMWLGDLRAALSASPPNP